MKFFGALPYIVLQDVFQFKLFKGIIIISVNDYRNPVIAEAMRVLGYVNRFNRGIARVQRELFENGNPGPVFDYQQMGVFGVTVFDSTYSPKTEDKPTPVADKADEKIGDRIRSHSIKFHNNHRRDDRSLRSFSKYGKKKYQTIARKWDAYPKRVKKKRNK